MVTKLIKYDFKSYLRILLPVQLILIGIAALNRIVQFFEPSGPTFGSFDSSGIYTTVFVSSIALYVISVIIVLLMTLIISIVRFYQGMYTNEGYLNHTLPVTSSQHIWAKLLTSLIFTFGSLFAIFISFMVITAGDMNIEIFKAFFYLAGKFFSAHGGHAALFVIEAAVLLILTFSFVYLKLYFCVSVGQLAKKKKILLAFGVYFAIYFINQIIYTIVIIFVTQNNEWISGLVDWASANPIAMIHIVLCTGIILDAIFSIIYFLITNYIMSKKLNLT